MLKVWKRYFVTVLLTFHGIPIMIFLDVIVGDPRIVNTCSRPPTTTRYIDPGTGTCYDWGPNETPYECCLFCRDDALVELMFFASQVVRPGGKNPFTTRRVNNQQCCCYTSGEVYDGTDGTLYHLE